MTTLNFSFRKNIWNAKTLTIPFPTLSVIWIVWSWHETLKLGSRAASLKGNTEYLVKKSYLTKKSFWKKARRRKLLQNPCRRWGESGGSSRRRGRRSAAGLQVLRSERGEDIENERESEKKQGVETKANLSKQNNPRKSEIDNLSEKIRNKWVKRAKAGKQQLNDMEWKVNCKNQECRKETRAQEFHQVFHPVFPSVHNAL